MNFCRSVGETKTSVSFDNLINDTYTGKLCFTQFHTRILHNQLSSMHSTITHYTVQMFEKFDSSNR